MGDQDSLGAPQAPQAPPQDAAPPSDAQAAPTPALPQDDLMTRLAALNKQQPSQPPVTLSASGQDLPPQTGTAGPMPPDAEAASAATRAQQTPNGDLMDRLQAINATQQKDRPGFWSRAGETSQLDGTVSALANKALRPIDLYNQAVKAAQQGDWQTASEMASKLFINASSMGLINPDDPLLEAAKALVMHPVEEIKAKAQEARKAISTAGGSKEELSNIIADHEAGNNIGAVGDVLGSVTSNPLVADLPGVGSMAKQMGGNLDQDFHEHNFAAVAGDLLGPIMAMGLGKGLGLAAGAATDTAEGLQSARAGTTEVAGVKIPQAKNSPGLARVDPGAAPSPGYSAVPEHSPAVTRLSNLASEGAAKNFVEQQAAPAAITATKANFDKSALASVDELRTVRNEPLASKTAPPLKTMDETAKFMKNEAQKTYQALDDAAQKDVDRWDARYGVWDDPAKTGAPPRPKLFSQMQDKLSDAQETMKSKFASQVDKSAAKAELPGLYQEMQSFLDKYKGVVSPNELQIANKVYGQSRRYDWIADKLRTGVKGTGTGTTTVAGPPKLNANFLENLPDAFDNKFGTDANPNAFEKLLGPDGMKNYNEVVQTLQQPITGAGGLMGWLNALPWKINGIAKVIPINQIADNLLFNPKAGSSMLSLYKMAKGISNVAHTGQIGEIAGVAASNVKDNFTDPHPNRQVAAAPAATPQDRGTVYDIGPMKGKPVSGMVKPGNIDVNHRPGIDNADGSHSSIFSTTIPLDKDGRVWEGDYDKAAMYALVPTIEHGHFMTKDGKLPPALYCGKDPNSTEATDAKRHLEDRAGEYYTKTGEHLGMFTSSAAADKYAGQTHAWSNDGTSNKIYTPSYNEKDMVRKPSSIKHTYQGASALAQ